MLVSAMLAVMTTSGPVADTYKIVEIDRHASFAGRLGQRVHENLVVEKDGQRYTISVRGDYHTRCVRPWQRLHEGDEVRMPEVRDNGSVDRDRISRVR